MMQGDRMRKREAIDEQIRLCERELQAGRGDGFVGKGSEDADRLATYHREPINMLETFKIKQKEHERLFRESSTDETRRKCIEDLKDLKETVHKYSSQIDKFEIIHAKEAIAVIHTITDSISQKEKVCDLNETKAQMKAFLENYIFFVRSYKSPKEKLNTPENKAASLQKLLELKGEILRYRHIIDPTDDANINEADRIISHIQFILDHPH